MGGIFTPATGEIKIINEPCDCPAGGCVHFVEPDTDCINRLTGDVRTMHCEKCNPGGSGATWHQDGVCLKCRHHGRAE